MEYEKGQHLHTGIHVFKQRIIQERRFLIKYIYIALYCSQITLLSNSSFKPNELVKQAKTDIIIAILEMRKLRLRHLPKDSNLSVQPGVVQGQRSFHSL